MATKVVDLGSVIGPQGPAGPQGATGPKGATGAQGPAGKDGANGKSAYQQAVDAGYTGTEAAFYAALVSLKDGPFLPLSGGKMAGNLDMSSKSIANVSSISAVHAETPHLILSSVDSWGLYSSEIDMSSDYMDIHSAQLNFQGDFHIKAEMADEPDVLIVDRVDGITFGKGLDMTAHKISGISAPTASTDAANKEYVDSKTLVFTAKTVPTTAWTANSTYSAQGYGFRASVACTGVTASHRPDVAFGAADSVGGNFAPFCDSYAGGVYIYCKEKPTATVTIPSIVCVRGA